MAKKSLQRKLRKLQANPTLFVQDLVRKRLLSLPAKESKQSNSPSVSFSTDDFEIVGDMAVITKAEVVAALSKQVGSSRTLVLSWK